jgi:NADPH-dependent 2,4-dienoyl-CoA reductase/sulfur reductase-like enzyme
VKGITALIETEALAIDRDNRTVRVRALNSGEERDLPYDKLVLATGASPVIPPIPGIELEGINTLQSMEDAVALKKVAVDKKVKHAVVVGGGLIGIETCEAFALAGIEMTVVEMLDQILPFLDWDMARLVQNHMESKGVRVITGQAVTRFHGDKGRVSGVELADGQKIACDHVVFSIGVRPNGKLAADAGLRVGYSGGITVNRFMQTADPHIYAAGDCTEVTNMVNPEQTALAHGRCGEPAGPGGGPELRHGKHPGVQRIHRHRHLQGIRFHRRQHRPV